MPGKLNLYNLGDLGVHLVETPVHSPDGSFTNAQNAAVSHDQGQHGVRKRPGMAKLNGDVLDGPVHAIANMPFQDPFPPVPSTGVRAFANEYNEGPTASYIESTNGTTWDPSLAALDGWQRSVRANRFTQRGGVISTPGRIIYLSPDGNLSSFDGTTSVQLTSGYTFGDYFSEAAPVLYQDVPVFAVHNATAGKLLRQSGGTLEELTTAIGKPALGVASILGRVYIGTDENRIYYWSETDNLVLDVTLTPSGGDVQITDIEHFDGVAYAAAATKNPLTPATSHKVLKRLADGSWSDITPDPEGDYGPIAAFGDALHVVRKTGGSFTGCEVHYYDGANWLTPFDIATIAPGAFGAIAMIAWNGAVYLTVSTPTTRDIVRSTAIGAWANVHSEAIFTTQFYVGLGFY